MTGSAAAGRVFAPPIIESENEDRGGASVLVNGAVFKTVSETVRTGSGRFDSYTPPPVNIADFRLPIADCSIVERAFQSVTGWAMKQIANWKLEMIYA